ITASRPLRHGVIADLDVTEEMLRQFIGRVHRGRLTHPRVIMCVPSGLTGVELSAMEEACLSAGALEVHLIDEPIAAAVGAGLDISEPAGRMVGDSSLLPGFPELLSEQTGMPAHLADSPLTCVAEGAGRSLEGLRGLTRKERT